MEYPIYEAKKNFSYILHEAGEHLKLFPIKNAQRHDAARIWVVGEPVIETILEGLRCTPEWEEDVEQGHWTVYIPELDIWGQGKTREEAADDLVTAALDYAAVYAEDVPFYLKFGRKHHLPFVWRLLLLGKEREKVKEFLGV